MVRARPLGAFCIIRRAYLDGQPLAVDALDAAELALPGGVWLPPVDMVVVVVAAAVVAVAVAAVVVAAVAVVAVVAEKEVVGWVWDGDGPRAAFSGRVMCSMTADAEMGPCLLMKELLASLPWPPSPPSPPSPPALALPPLLPPRPLPARRPPPPPRPRSWRGRQAAAFSLCDQIRHKSAAMAASSGTKTSSAARRRRRVISACMRRPMSASRPGESTASRTNPSSENRWWRYRTVSLAGFQLVRSASMLTERGGRGEVKEWSEGAKGRDGS